MATEVGSAYVTLLPSARGFRSGIERQISGDVTRAGTSSGQTFGRSFSAAATGSIRRASASIGSSLRSLGSRAVASLKVVTAAAGAATAGFATLGLSTAANLQTAQIGFETLLGSAKQAASFIGQLRRFAVATPFETEGLIQNARALLGVGTQAKNVIPTLTALGDATGALGLSQDQFNGILRAYTQIASKGKVQAEELLQISENGVPAVQLFAKALGLTVPQLQALTKEGQLTADVALPALLAQLNKDYGGSMSRQFNTLTGVFNNFKETAKLALADGVQPLLPILQNALPSATAAVGRGIAAASSALAGFIRGIQGAQFDDGKVSFFEQFGAAAKKAFTAIRAGVVAALPVLGRLLAFVVGDLVPALRDAFERVFPQVKATFGDIANVIRDNQGTFRALGTMLTKVIIPTVAEVARLFAKVLGPAFTVVVVAIRSFLIPATVSMARAFLLAFDFIISAAAKAFGWVPGIGPKLKAANRAFDKFASGINEALDSIIKDVTVNVHVRTTTSDIAGGIDGRVLSPQQAAAANRQAQITARAEKSAKDAADKLKKPTTDVFKGLGGLLSTSLADGVTDGAGKVAKAAKDTVSKAAKAAKDALKSARDDLRSYAESVRDSITSFGSIVGITGDDRDVTPNTVARFLQHQLAAIAEFQRNLKTLAARGISDSLLQQIADAGVENGGAVASALVAADKGQFAAIQATDRRIQKRATSIGQLAANRVLGDEVARAKVNIERIVINNPKPERASESVPKALKRTTFAAGLGSL